jgi:addiction module RelB/DinJ family antitoxin
VQFRVDDDVKSTLETVFGSDGMTTAQGMKVIAYQIARSGRSPFRSAYAQMPNERTRQAIAEARAYEDGTHTDTRKRYDDAHELASDILGEQFS